MDLQLDDQGRIIDFTIVSAPGQQNETLRRSIKNHLLFTEFWPATTFGRGVAGTIRISFRNKPHRRARIVRADNDALLPHPSAQPMRGTILLGEVMLMTSSRRQFLQIASAGAVGAATRLGGCIPRSA